MSIDISRREVLAGVVAIPWLVACSPGIDKPAGVIEELLPLLGRKGLTTDRVGLLGWSMGGYGALLLATKLGPTRVAGVVAASAALWQSPR